MPPRVLTDTARRALQVTRLYEPARRLKAELQPPVYEGARITPRRLLNAYLVRYQHARGDIKLRGYPLVLTIESTNACNLRCPYCFTGAGEDGRPKSMLQLPLYERVLDEVGDYLWQVEFYNWGEPLLNKSIASMVGAAAAKGISTTISSNLSIPFDAERAEELVASGLHVLGVSIDGATQENYEKYRVRGKLDLVLDNVRLINEAKRKLSSRTPRMIWEFHVFDHNKHEIEQARAMASELGMDLAVDKGWVAGAEWDPRGEYQFWVKPAPARCGYLWQRAIVHNDGGVAPCCGTFYKEDDFGHIRSEPSVRLSDLEGATFHNVWNNATFQDARRMFRDRHSTPDSARRLVCYDCPATLMWDAYKKHRAQGSPSDSFDPGFTANDGFNYFFERKPERARRAPAGDVIPLNTVTVQPDRAR
jgi:organic radical activating enzyme